MNDGRQRDDNTAVACSTRRMFVHGDPWEVRRQQ
jgi:hypothetical protein